MRHSWRLPFTLKATGLLCSPILLSGVSTVSDVALGIHGDRRDDHSDLPSFGDGLVPLGTMPILSTDERTERIPPSFCLHHKLIPMSKQWGVDHQCLLTMVKMR